MNILFIYTVQKSLLFDKPLKGQEDIQMGISLMSAILKKNGYSTDLLVLDRRFGKKNYKKLSSKIESKKFDLICFSSVYSEFSFIYKLAKFVNSKYDMFSILGGVHTTISPDESYLNVFDALCIGEGDEVIIELANAIKNRKDISEIHNLWTKKDGKIIKNPTRSFVPKLNDIPFVDRDIWQPFIFEKNSQITVLIARGCPYNCSYCSNHKLREISPGKYVRMRSAENIIEELDFISNKFPQITEYFLEIETLGANIKWLYNLCNKLEEYNKTRTKKLSFSANLRIHNNMKFDEVFANLKKANFESITVGLESGNERIRREILNRKYSNDSIIKAVETARKYDVKIGIFNLMGLPTESHNDFLETLKLNQLIQPYWHATSIYFPYKGTQLYNIAKNLDLIPKSLNFKNERQHAVLNLPEFSQHQIQKEFDRFHYNVYKKGKNKNIVKTVLFLMQSVLGHSFMANSKNRLIVLFYKLGIKNKLNKIFQKS